MCCCGFVILHYQTEEDTINCVESIEKCVKQENYHIIIVDNASPNKTGNHLKELYSESNNITVLLNSENLGFAKGNNVGFRYAKEELNCDYIVCLNSDTKMVDKDFCRKVINEYEYSKCYVIGPKILKHGKELYDNPRRIGGFNRRRIRLFLIINQIMLALNYLRLDVLASKIFDIYVGNKKVERVQKQRCEGVTLHGCCLVFTPAFVKTMNGFDDRTFMYMEEDILYECVKSHNGTMVYLPELTIEHLEGGSTDKRFKSTTLKRRFIYKNTIQSVKILMLYITT